MIRSCPTCGRRRPPSQSHCNVCLAAGAGPERGPRGQWSQGRDLGEQARFRQRVGDAAEWRCQFIVRPAVESVTQFEPFRCAVVERSDLFAHHGQDGDPDLLLCRRHHRVVDQFAR